MVLARPAEWRWAWLGFAGGALLVTWWADRSACWGPPPAGPDRPGVGRRPVRLVRPLTAGLLAGVGGAGVWTFGPDVTTRSLSPQTAGLLWCLLGAARPSSAVWAGASCAGSAWPAPEAPAQATARLFIALTIGEAAGAALLGALADAAGAPVAFVAAAALVSAAALAAPRDRRRRTLPAGWSGRRRHR